MDNNTYKSLESVRPDHELIMGTNNIRDFDDESSSVKTGSFNTNYETSKDEMDVEELYSTESIIDLCSNNSDADTDNNDDNIYTSASNATVKQASVRKSVSCISDPFATIETYGITPISISYDTECATTNIKILTADNNEPGNNLNSVQNLKNQLKPTSESQDNNHEADFMERLSSPIPYDSDNSEDIASHVCDKKIKEEAVQICNLLSTYKYELVYKALCKNDKAKNRVELSLWDLLPNKRPKIKYFQDSSVQSKRRKQNMQTRKAMSLYNSNASINDDTASNATLNSNTTQGSKKTALQTNCENGLLEHSAETGKVSSVTEGGILRPAKLLIDYKSQRTEHVTSPRSFVLHPPKLRNITLKQLKNVETAFVRRDVQNLPKYLVNNTNSLKEHTLFRYMQYLKYMQTIKQQKLNGQFKHFNLNNRNKVRQSFLESDCANFSVPKRNQVFGGAMKMATNKKTKSQSNKNAVRKNIALPLQFQQTHRMLAFKFPQIDEYYIKQICRNLSELSNTYHSQQLQTVAIYTVLVIVDFANLCASINVLNASSHQTVSSNTTVNSRNSNISVRQTALAKRFNLSFVTGAASSSSNLRSARIMNSNVSLNSIDDIPLATASSKPSTSAATCSVPETNQAFGGARRKEIIKKNGSESNKNVEKKDIVLPLIFQEMYEILVLKFPQIDRYFIKQTCKNLSELKEICSIEQLEILAVHRLQKKEIQSADTDMKSFLLEDVENEQYTYLLGIFPNADPAYLRKIVSRAHNNPTEIINFIQTQWEQPTYPTKEEKLQKIKIAEEQMWYTNNFDVKKFLEIFPDPVTYFTNPTRNCKSNDVAIDVLKSHFSHLEVFNLKRVYSLNNYNLTLTVEELENLPPYKKLTRNVNLWEKYPPKDIPLLQECAFIIHREEIVEYLTKLKEAEAKEFEEIKRKNEFLECQCCYDKECVPSKCSTCDDGHVFCNSCILKGTELQLAQGNARISCFSDCDGEFTVPTLQKILPPTQFSIYIRKKQEMEVMAAGVEGLVSCPFCHFASIPPPEDKVFKCLNPECMKESCRFCKELNHIPLRCYEDRSDKARLLLEEKMTEALVRKCYKCGRPYFKVDGCNKITCCCGAMMCYICDTPIQNYSHFNNGGCSLHSDNHLINSETVRAVAMRTMQLIKEKDPKVEVSTDDLLKNLPSISSDYAITGRVQKVTKFDE